MDCHFDPRGKLLSFTDFDGDSRDTGLIARIGEFLHLKRTSESGKIGGKFMVIGLHGWVPTWMLRAVIGQPQVTSSLLTSKFEIAMKKLRPDAEILGFPLEAEGTILQRVNKHFEQISADEVATELLADTYVQVVFISHSQGVPIAAFLVKRLLESGHLKGDLRRIHVLGLAGILEGPDPRIRQNLAVRYVEGRPAKELFHFGRWSTKLKSDLDSWLRQFLSGGGMITLIGGWQDQVVPISSSLMCSFLAHPNLNRAIYVSSEAEEESYPLIKLAQTSLLLLNSPNLCDLGSKLLASLAPELVENLYKGKMHTEIAMAQTNYDHFAQAVVSGRHRLGTPSASSEALIDIDQHYIGWLLNDLKRCDDPRVRLNVQELTEMLKNWTPSGYPWMELRQRLRPLLDQPISKL